MDGIQRVIEQCEDIHSPALINVDPDIIKSLQIDYALRQKCFFVARIHSKINGEQELFTALYEACNFPDWFGFNWDALKDSLLDFEWQPALGYVLIFEEGLSLDHREQGLFHLIMEYDKGIWEKHGHAFKLLLPLPSG